MPVFGYTVTINTNDETPAGKTTTVETYRMPDKILLRQQKDTYTRSASSSISDGGFGFSPGGALLLSKSDVKTLVWESSVYGPNGPLNQPKELSEETKSYGWLTTQGTNFGVATTSKSWQLLARI